MLALCGILDHLAQILRAQATRLQFVAVGDPNRKHFAKSLCLAWLRWCQPGTPWEPLIRSFTAKFVAHQPLVGFRHSCHFDAETGFSGCLPLPGFHWDLKCAGFTRHKKSTLCAHEMAVRAIVSQKIHAESSSNLSMSMRSGDFSSSSFQSSRASGCDVFFILYCSYAYSRSCCAQGLVVRLDSTAAEDVLLVFSLDGCLLLGFWTTSTGLLVRVCSLCPRSFLVIEYLETLFLNFTSAPGP